MMHERHTLSALRYTQFCRGLVYTIEVTTASISSLLTPLATYLLTPITKAARVLHCTFMCSDCSTTTEGGLYRTGLS